MMPLFPPARAVYARRMAELRPATDGDGEAILQLLTSVFGEYPPVLMDRSEFPELAHPRRAFEAMGGELWVVEEDGLVIGSGGYSITATPGLAELRKVYLLRPFRGRGLGRRLVRVAEDAARSRGCVRMHLYSDIRFVHAHGMYEHLGYRRLPDVRALGDVSNTLEFHFDKSLTS